jgi:hypothetical protein
MDQDSVKFLIERKIDFLNSVAQVCVIWWASSVVFCGSILAGVWAKREELKERKLLHSLGFVLLVFFSSIVVSGYIAISRYLRNVQKEIADLTKQLGFQDEFFHTEVSSFESAMWAGISSFVIVWAAWIFMWGLLWWRLPPKLKQPEQSMKKPAVIPQEEKSGAT